MKNVLKLSLVAVMILSLVLSFSLIGCKEAAEETEETAEEVSEDTQEAAEETSEEVAEETQESADAPGVDEPIKVLCIVLSLADQFMIEVAAGYQIQHEGVTTEVYIEDPKADAAKEVEIIESYLSRDIDAIIVYPIDANALVPVVKEATAKGIKVISAGPPFEGAEVGIAPLASEWDGGSLIGKYMVKWWRENRPDEKANVLALGFPSLQFAFDRDIGFWSYFSAQMGDQAELIGGYQETKGQAEAAQTVTETMLIANPEINFIYCINNPVYDGAVAAAEQAGRNDIVYSAFDVGQSIVNALAEGINEEGGGLAVTSVNVTGVGWAYDLMSAAIKAVQGEDLPEDYLNMSVRAITPDNIGDFLDEQNFWREKAGLDPLVIGGQ